MVTFLKIIEHMYPVVKCMLDDMCDAAKDKMMQIDCAGDFGGVEFPTSGGTTRLLVVPKTFCEQKGPWPA